MMGEYYGHKRLDEGDTKPDDYAALIATLRIGNWTHNTWASTPTSGMMNVRTGAKEPAEAADLIERQSAEIARQKAGGCARDQKLTQHCAEAVAAEAQVKEWIAANGPGGWIDDLRAQVRQLQDENAELQSENDSWSAKLSDAATKQLADSREIRQLQEALDAWSAWFRRTGDGSMAGKSDAEYQALMQQWVRDGAAMSKEPQK